MPPGSTITPRTLRDYQREASDAVLSTWASGINRTSVVLPTGSGKSTVGADIAVRSYRDFGLNVAFIAHRDLLLGQLADSVAQVDPSLPSVGIVQGPNDEADAPIIAASIQTLMNSKRLERVGQRRVVIWDECFVAGTPVDGRPIETLQVGDYVTAWSADGEVTRRRVTAVMSSVPSSLVRVTTADGQSFVCTPGHPFLTPFGWVPAGSLPHDVTLHHVGTSSMHDVCEPCRPEHQEQAGQVQSTRTGVLLSGMCACVPDQSQLGNHVTHQSKICACTDADKQSNEGSTDARQGIRRSQVLGLAATNSTREREPHARTSSPLGRSAVRVGSRVSDRSSGWGEPSSILRGSGTSTVQSDCGGRRSQSSDHSESDLGQTTRREISATRLVDVAVLEPGSDGRYGGMCPDGLVYNLEVDTDHTYTVGTGVVVHNCHHAGAVSWTQVLRDMGGFRPDHFFCGLTATLRREDGKALRDVIQTVAFERSLRWAVEQGFLVMPTGLTVRIPDLDLGKVKVTAGDFQQNDLAEVMEAANPYVVQAIMAHARDRRPIIFAASVDAAHMLAHDLNEQGMSARAVTGDTPTAIRDEIFDAFRRGDTQALVTVQVLTEGADFPMCDCAVLARPTRSQNLYSQMVGRALRTYPGKTDALVLDLAGSSRVLSLVTLSDLDCGSTSKKIELDGTEIPPEDDEEAVPTGRAPRSIRTGPVDLVTIDLLGSAQTGVNWLQTRGGYPFVQPTGAGYFVFLWPDGNDLWKVGAQVSRKRMLTAPLDPGWLDEGKAWPVDIAAGIAEDFITDRGDAYPLRKASWRRNQAPSDGQLQIARTYLIAEPEQYTKAALSDLISVAIVSRYLDPQ